jgi:group II intron reverse transcriptase/maturase
MRNPIHVLKSLEEKVKNSQYRYERLYRNLYNPEFYLLAYKNIASSQGSMTAGTDGMTLDAMSMARINRIIISLKGHSYQPNPAKRVYIPKKNSNKKRPLGIPSTDDKLVQEIVRMILEAIYEPIFSKRSHGFRPHHSCHTALEEVQTIFSGVKWIVEGDIHACFDSFDHHVLINILRRRIHDEYFISLMWKFLKAGYMEQWQFNKTYSGTPQGSGMSPILANIYLSQLDRFIEEYKQNFDKGNSKHRVLNRAYSRLQSKYMYESSKFKKLKSQLSPAECAKISKQLRKIQMEKLATPYYPAIEPDFRRIQYNRYADDFLIGVIGSREDAQQVKADVKRFLQEKLNLVMSEEKTKITHSSELVRYLGYDLTVSRDKSFKRNENGALIRVHYGKVQLYLPKEKWIDKLREYKAFKIKKDENGAEKWKALHRGILMDKSEVEIISKYNVEIRGIYNFYRLAQNVSVLGKFRGIMKSSMLKTFAAKHNSSIEKIKAGRMKNGLFGVYYTTKSGVKRCEFYNEKLVKQKIAAPSLTDTLPQYQKYIKPNSLAARLQGRECELCDAKTDTIKMHHVKSLKSLKGSRPSEFLMMEMCRKSLALCEDCFEKVSTGLL